ncbi:Uncharacterised protein [Segatella copri]|nr:Uncharacterised protein [Segatella copri]
MRFVPIGRKFPNQPKIVKALHATQRIRVTKFGFKNNLSFQFCYQSSLFGYAKLATEGRTKICYWFYLHIY